MNTSAHLIAKQEERATYQDLARVPVPTYTRTHKPVRYTDLVDCTYEAFGRAGLQVKSEQFALARGGSVMVGAITFESPSTDRSIAAILRGCYGKQTSVCVGVGAQVAICTNLELASGEVRYMRKNTTYAWGDVREQIDRLAARALPAYEAGLRAARALEATTCTLDRGYELLGRALGRGILAQRQASVAFTDWTNPRHQEVESHDGRHLGALYQCMTEGLKVGSPVDRIERQTSAHEFILSEVSQGVWA